MNESRKAPDPQTPGTQPLDAGLACLSLIAGYYRIAADPAQLRHQLALTGRSAGAEELVRAANFLRLKSRILRSVTAKRLGAIPYPAILALKDGGFAVLAIAAEKGRIRIVDALTRTAREGSPGEAEALSVRGRGGSHATRRLGGAGVDPNTFGFRWFWPSILRYRRPLAHVLVASLFVQIFALATPIFFQLVVDKVLVHKDMSTLVVLIVRHGDARYVRDGPAVPAAPHTLSHTTNRIDVELGRRLFSSSVPPAARLLSKLRAAGQTVARGCAKRRSACFLTGQGLTVGA